MMQRKRPTLEIFLSVGLDPDGGEVASSASDTRRRRCQPGNRLVRRPFKSYRKRAQCCTSAHGEIWNATAGM